MWAAPKILRRNILCRVKRCKTTELTIGDVVIRRNLDGNTNLGGLQDTVPPFFKFDAMPKEIIMHMRWMAQKYSMGQDMFLCGHPGPLRRRLALAFADAAGLEVEYVAISRDTTENDLKQRREIRGNSVVFHDQAPVRAAIHGRLLVLDGIEFAERNVLPTLNNLLENREMALEDGRFLTTAKTIAAIRGPTNTLVPVHPDFRVIALGQCVPPYNGRTMDPPLRSRFQSRFVDELSSESVLELFASESSGIDKKKLQAVVGFYESLRLVRTNALHESSAVSLTGLPVYSIDSIDHTLSLLRKFPSLPLHSVIDRSVPGISWLLDAVPNKFKHSVLTSTERLGESSPKAIARESSELTSVTVIEGNPSRANLNFSSGTDKSEVVCVECSCGSSGIKASHSERTELLNSLMSSQREVLNSMFLDHSLGRHLCVLGPRGSGKSHLARVFGDILGYRVRTLPMYQEVTARDLLQRRVTESEASSGEANRNKTSWVDSPLVAAARNGDLCILDGLERVDSQVLYTLRMLLQDGIIDLPNGERLSSQIFKTDPTSPLAIKPGFRVIALGLTPPPNRLDDARDRYISSSLGFSYFEMKPASVRDMMAVIGSDYASSHSSGIVSKSLSHSSADAVVDSNTTLLLETVNCLLSVGSEHPELKLSLRHILRLHRLIDNAEIDLDKSYMLKTLERTLMIPFMPALLSTKFYDAVRPELGKPQPQLAPLTSNFENDERQSIIVNEAENYLQIGKVRVPRRASTNPELIPRPLFHQNSAHLACLEELLFAFQAGERSLLLIGNQGVGKNKLVDRLLELMNAEREYIQLHRDTTIQSLTILPSLEDGQIKYEDSPMIRAARLGRVLVVDEADKAPLEVVCLLKALAEDGEVILYDGRRLLSQARLQAEGWDASNPPNDIIAIHPDFALFVLANRPGFPFLGNNFFRECGDAFSVHVVENLDYKSEIELLRAYGPNVHVSVLSKLAASFAALRDAHSKGDLTYPFSAREAVAVVKHLQNYPQDGVASAVEDILGFDSLTPILRSQIAQIFQNNGLPVPLFAAGTAQASPPLELSKTYGIPPPALLPVRFAEAVRACPVSSPRSMRCSDWTAHVTLKSSYAIESTRLLKFSEEIGRISLTKNHEDARHSLWAGRVVGMVNDNSVAGNGSVHVLTSDPLTVHSFHNVGSAIDAIRGREIDPSQNSSQLIKRELLSEDLSYRMGSIQPIFVPLTQNSSSAAAESRYSCAVVLPDMSMALAIPSDPTEAVKMLTLPLKNVVQHARDKYKDAVRMFSKDNSSNMNTGVRKGTPTAVSSIDRAGFTLYYHRNGSLADVIALDFKKESVTSIDISQSFAESDADVVIRSITSLGSDCWLIDVGQIDAATASRNYLLTLRTADKIISADLKQFVVPSKEFGAAPLAAALPVDTHKQLSFSNRASFGTSGEVVLGGNGNSLARQVVVSNLSPSEVKVWARHATAAEESSGSGNVTTSILMSSAFQNSSSNIRIEREENSLSKKSSYAPFLTPTTVTLEAVDIKNNSYKNINLERPIHSVDPLYSVVSIGSVSTSPNAAGAKQSDVSVVLHADGVLRLFETDAESLSSSHQAWQALYSSRKDEDKWGISKKVGKDAKSLRDVDQEGKPRTGLNAPKHGKEDPNNDPHVGGNTWAGGTGGSDTAGLGGRGGPYRLDKGHGVHQVSESMKAEVSEAARQQARKIAREALNKRLEEIQMGKNDYHTYMQYKKNIESQIGQLRATFEELSRRAQERVWLRHQNHGDLDDSKLVDGLAGDRLVFKRRGVPDSPNQRSDNSGDAHKKRLQFVVDVSGSMYRFNGQDRRLERMLEAALLIMESMPSTSPRPGDSNSNETTAKFAHSEEGNIDYCVSGHSGDSNNIRFLDFNMPKPSNEQERLEVLEAMVAHSQYCSSGDNTLSAVGKAVDNILANTEDDQKMERFVFVMSDANFDRYGISPSNLARAMTKDKRVKVHFILIASLADEAERIAKALPAGHAHICFDTQSIPTVMKSILTSAMSSTMDL